MHHFISYKSSARYLILIIKGVKTTKRASLLEVRNSIPGFLELCSKAKFQRLQSKGYNSLLMFKAFPVVTTLDKKDYYSVLFGPLALVNSNHNIREQFYHADSFGDLLLWKVRTTFENVCSIIFTYYYTSSICIIDAFCFYCTY